MRRCHPMAKPYDPATASITLKCPYCGGTLTQRPSRWGRFFGCSGFPKCDATVGCHPTGHPLGTPANRTLKDARMRLHQVFDPLWQGRAQDARGKTYDALAYALRLDINDCHIGLFDLAMCERAMAAIARGDVGPAGPGLAQPRRAV